MNPVLFVLFVAATGAQAPTASAPKILGAAEFATAPRADKRATLNALAAHRVPAPPEEVAFVIEAGLLDVDDDVRLSAVYAAAGRAAGARFGLDKRFLDTWNAERSALSRLRPIVLKTLADTNPRIREGAIIAIGNMDFEPGVRGIRVRLRDDSVDALLHRLSVETHPSVRIELAKSLALTQPDARTHDRLFALLADPSSEVVQYAVMGFGQSKAPEALPRLLPLLKHGDRGVRLMVAQSLAAQAEACSACVKDLEEALQVEQDDIVRKTLDGTLTAIRKALERK